MVTTMMHNLNPCNAEVTFVSAQLIKDAKLIENHVNLVNPVMLVFIGKPLLSVLTNEYPYVSGFQLFLSFFFCIL